MGVDLSGRAVGFGEGRKGIEKARLEFLKLEDLIFSYVGHLLCVIMCVVYGGWCMWGLCVCMCACVHACVCVHRM